MRRQLDGLPRGLAQFLNTILNRAAFLQIFDAINSSWASALWKRASRTFARFQFGYTVKRSRLHALLLVRIILWRYQQDAHSTLAAFFIKQMLFQVLSGKR